MAREMCVEQLPDIHDDHTENNNTINHLNKDVFWDVNIILNIEAVLFTCDKSDL